MIPHRIVINHLNKKINKKTFQLLMILDFKGSRGGRGEETADEVSGIQASSRVTMKATNSARTILIINVNR